MGLSKKLTFFWAPNVNWVVNEENLVIGECIFSLEYVPLFPKLYFLAQKGIDTEMLQSSFLDFSKIKLKRFVKKLIELHILISHVQDTYDLFYGQQRLLEEGKEYDHDFFMNADNDESFRSKMINRDPLSKDVKYKFEFDDQIPEMFFERRSTRQFDKDEKMSGKQLEKILSAISRYSTENGTKCCYPSAGGLYPVDCYVLIKENRVEEIEKGLYFYDPLNYSLNFVSEGKKITKMSHFFLNREMFENSAVSLFLVYDAAVSIPKYDSRAYYYATLDAGKR